MSHDKQAYDFFKQQGFNAENSLALARAERWAHAEGLLCCWDVDEHCTYEAWYEYRRGDSIGPEPSEILCCQLFKPQEGDYHYDPARGTVLESLGGIENPSRGWRRVIEAELALQAMQAAHTDSRG